MYAKSDITFPQNRDMTPNPTVSTDVSHKGLSIGRTDSLPGNRYTGYDIKNLTGETKLGYESPYAGLGVKVRDSGNWNANAKLKPMKGIEVKGRLSDTNDWGISSDMKFGNTEIRANTNQNDEWSVDLKQAIDKNKTAKLAVSSGDNVAVGYSDDNMFGNKDALAIGGTYSPEAQQASVNYKRGNFDTKLAHTRVTDGEDKTTLDMNYRF